jgi:hypothetical protein
MNKTSKLILKTAAALMILIGLTAMLVAWDLLLAANVHNSTVLVLEMGGVVVCMAGYFLWRHARGPKKSQESQISSANSID